MTPEERAIEVIGGPGPLSDEFRGLISAAIREAERDAQTVEREAILAALRTLRDSHSPTHDWAHGVDDAIAAVRARADE